MQVVELGCRLCIVLPQLAGAQGRLAQARWLAEARALREDCAALTPAVLARLLRDADSVLPHRRVEQERAALYKLRGTPQIVSYLIIDLKGTFMITVLSY